MMDTILPCPFCGKSPEIENCEDGSIWASCSDSSMKCPAYGNGAELAAWNRRSPQPSAPVQRVNIKDYKDTAIGEVAGIPFVYPNAVGEDKHLRNPASPSAPREPTEAEREALWAALRASGEIVHPGRLTPSAQPQPEEGVKELIADGFIAAILHGDEKHQQWLKDFNLSKHLKPAPEPSVAAEACKHPSEKTRSIHFGREGFAHWCQACGSFRPGEGCKWIAPAAHPGIVPGWVPEDKLQKVRDMFAAAAHAFESPLTPHQRGVRDGYLSAILLLNTVFPPAAPKGQP